MLPMTKRGELSCKITKRTHATWHGFQSRSFANTLKISPSINVTTDESWEQQEVQFNPHSFALPLYSPFFGATNLKYGSSNKESSLEG